MVGETGYLVQRSESSSFDLEATEGVAADVTTLTQSVSRGKTYWYRVLAFDSTQESGWSAPVTVTTP